MARILIEHNNVRRWVELNRFSTVSIGRSPENDIVLDDPSASRFHALIEIVGDELWIVDLHSINGVKVNGTRVQRHRLLYTHQVSIAGYTLTLLPSDERELDLRVEPEFRVNAPPPASIGTRGQVAASNDDFDEIGSSAPAPTRRLDGPATGELMLPRSGYDSPPASVTLPPRPPEVTATMAAPPPPSSPAPSRNAPGSVPTQGYKGSFAGPPPGTGVRASAPPWPDRMYESEVLKGSPERPQNLLAEGFAQNVFGFHREQVRAPGIRKQSWWRRFLPGHKYDLVDCSVFAPPRIEPGQRFMVQAFAHCPIQAAQVAAMAKEFDQAADRRGKKTLAAQLARGAWLSFHLSLPNFQIPEAVQHLRWFGEPESVQFEVHAPSHPRETSAIGRVTISCDGVPLGHLSVKFELVERSRSDTNYLHLAGDSAHAYRKAFISYASTDRTEVLKRVQMLSRLGVSYFQDLLSFEPGDRWQRELYRHIDESDLFLLFWSTAARDSKWVREEVRYALARKGGDDELPPAIVPVIIEGPPPVDPPEELAHLHFNDYLTYFFQR